MLCEPRRAYASTLANYGYKLSCRGIGNGHHTAYNAQTTCNPAATSTIMTSPPVANRPSRRAWANEYANDEVKKSASSSRSSSRSTGIANAFATTSRKLPRTLRRHYQRQIVEANSFPIQEFHHGSPDALGYGLLQRRIVSMKQGRSIFVGGGMAENGVAVFGKPPGAERDEAFVSGRCFQHERGSSFLQSQSVLRPRCVHCSPPRRPKSRRGRISLPQGAGRRRSNRSRSRRRRSSRQTPAFAGRRLPRG